MLRWRGLEWIEGIVAYFVGLPSHHTIVHERVDTTWTRLGTIEIHMQLSLSLSLNEPVRGSAREI